MRVREKNAVDFFHHAPRHHIFREIQLPLAAAIEQKPVAVIRHNDAAGGKLNNPFRRFHVQTIRHQLNLRALAQHALTANTHALLLEIPVQRVGGKIVAIQRAHAGDQLIDGRVWLTDDRPARGIDHIQIRRAQFLKA